MKLLPQIANKPNFKMPTGLKPLPIRRMPMSDWPDDAIEKPLTDEASKEISRRLFKAIKS